MKGGRFIGQALWKGEVAVSVYLSVLLFYSVDGRWLNVPVGRWCNDRETANAKFREKNLFE